MLRVADLFVTGEVSRAALVTHLTKEGYAVKTTKVKTGFKVSVFEDNETLETYDGVPSPIGNKPTEFSVI